MSAEKPRGYRFEIYQDKRGEYRARFCYNSEVMFFTEGYRDIRGARNAVASMKNFGPVAEIADLTEGH